MLQIEQLDVQIAKQGATVDRLLNRGDLYRRHQDYAAAAWDFEQARGLDPENDQLGFFVGRLQLEMGDPTAARISLREYLAIHPEHARGWSLLAEANVQLGDAQAAAEHYQKAITHSASASPELYRARVLSLLAIGQQAWQEADLALREGLELLGTEVNLLGLAVDLALAEANTARAEKLLAQLPAGLERLPQWNTRKQLAACESDNCLEQARAQLRVQGIEFLESN